MKFADPKSDIAFKKVFGNENKREILISFLNAVLDLHGEQVIVDITILNPYQAPKISLLKETNLDVRAKTKGGVTFIVEMQVEKQDYFAKRALYYTAKAYVAQLETAESYPKLNQVIFIGILDFTLFTTQKYLSKHLILDADTHEQEIKDLELNFIELPKFHLQEPELTTIIEKWIYFFKHAGEFSIIPDSLSDTPEIVEAFDILAQHNWTQDELDIYDYWQMKEAGHKDALETAKRDGRKNGMQEGMQEGIKKGTWQEKRRLAKNLKALGVEIEVICQATGLTRENIEQLEE